jgi:hypothetical protein
MATIANTAVSFWTYTLTSGTLTIDTTYNLTQISFELTTGTATFTGTAQAGSTPSAAIALVVGNPITLSSSGPNSITGITIDATSGTVVIIGKN